MAEESSFSFVAILVFGVAGLVVVGCLFGLIYWVLGRGKDDDAS